MSRDWTVDELIAFEADIEAEFNAGHIKAPVHLAGGNERELIDIFRGIGENDWVCGGWRAHYHCLLRGVPPADLKAAILAGRSIALCFPQQRVICSAIVGGICPIAAGIAWSIKQRGGNEWVHCFIGDMAEMSGINRESRRYAGGHDLPIKWWIEDNGKSVSTDTQQVWGHYSGQLVESRRYLYTLNHDHVGTGKWVSL